MTITGEQVKAARRLLGWTQDTLAVETRVSPTIISHLETGRRRVAVLSVSVIQRALEEAGVEFTNGDRPGVKLKKARRSAIRDEDALPELPKNGRRALCSPV